MKGGEGRRKREERKREREREKRREEKRREETRREEKRSIVGNGGWVPLFVRLPFLPITGENLGPLVSLLSDLVYNLPQSSGKDLTGRLYVSPEKSQCGLSQGNRAICFAFVYPSQNENP